MEKALTFDDVALVPQYTTAKSRKNIDLRSKFTRNIYLNTPLISSCMDSVTEDQMCIAMARKGGIGILHRYCSIEEQVEMVRKVKRAQNIIIENPYTISKDYTLQETLDYMNQKKVNTLIITTEDKRYRGMLDKHFLEDQIRRYDQSKNMKLKSFPNLTREVPILDPDFQITNAIELMSVSGNKKLPIIDQDSKLLGLITLKDIENKSKYPLMSLDNKGRLLVGVAVGIRDDYLERLEKLIEAEADVVVLDTAYGNSDQVITVLKQVKELYPDIDFIVGNVCSGEGYKNLVEAGADGVRLGIGSSRICSTRLVSGFGMPQITALLECKKVKDQYNYDVPIISDGGIKKSGDIVKAIVAGADTIMMGTGLSGTDQSAGKIIYKNGVKGKVVRGMAGTFANLSKAERTNTLADNDEPFDIPAEGIDSFVEYKGSVYDILDKYINGIKSGVSYGGGTLEQLKKVRMVEISSAGKAESGVKEFL